MKLLCVCVCCIYVISKSILLACILLHTSLNVGCGFDLTGQLCRLLRSIFRQLTNYSSVFLLLYTLITLHTRFALFSIRFVVYCTMGRPSWDLQTGIFLLKISSETLFNWQKLIHSRKISCVACVVCIVLLSVVDVTIAAMSLDLPSCRIEKR